MDLSFARSSREDHGSKMGRETGFNCAGKSTQIPRGIGGKGSKQQQRNGGERGRINSACDISSYFSQQRKESAAKPEAPPD